MSSSTDNANETGNFSGPVDPTLVFGPKRDALYIVLPITLMYTLIFITGLFGNIFTCTVIIRNKSMHTATNYYLFSLAISDLLYLVSGMPQEIYSIWFKWPYVFGQAFCLLRGLAAETSTNASVMTITLFTIERYLAICHPFVSHKMSKLSRAVKHILIVWLVSFGLALPQALQFGVKDLKGVTMCIQTRVIIQHSFEISTFVFFLAPMVLITVLYALIGIRLKSTYMERQAKEKEDYMQSLKSAHKIRRRHSQSTRRVVKMLVAVVIAFFICWAPFHAQRLVAIYGTDEHHMARSPIFVDVYSAMTYISGVFYYMSTCINPIFYHIMSNNFREAFKNTVRQFCCHKPEPRAGPRCSYTAMPFGRHPNSGTSTKSDPGNRTTYEGRDSFRHGAQQWRVCSYCNKAADGSEKVNGCRLHHCSYRFLDDTGRKLVNETDTEFGSSQKRRSQLANIPSGDEKTICCGPNCVKNCRKKSLEDSFTPPTPEPYGSNSSDVNSTQLYPETDKFSRGISLKIISREKPARSMVL